METQTSEVKLKSWLQSLGYNGAIPDSLSYFCNSSTSFIWTQLAENAHSKQYVDHVKNNLIINRISRSDDQDDFGYPIEEIELLNRKSYLQEKKASIERRLAEKRETLDKLKSNNNLTYLSIQNTKAKIRQNAEQEYIFKSKTLAIEDELNEGEENLAIVRQLTPTEMDENVDSNVVRAVLEECVKKLNGLLPKVKQNACNTTKNSVFNKYLTPHKKTGPEMRSQRESLGILPDHFMNEVEFSLDLTDDVPSFHKKPDLDSPSKFIDFIMNNKQMSDKFRLILSNYNRNFIFRVCSSMQDELLGRLKGEFGANSPKKTILEPKCEDMIKMYAEHVKLEVTAAQHERRLYRMAAAILEAKKTLLNRLDKDQLAELMASAENAGLSYSFHYVKAQMNKVVHKNKSNKLNNILSRLAIVQERIGVSMNEIENRIDSIRKVLELMENNKIETENNVHRLNALFKDLSWMNLLLENVNLQEVDVLKEFPIRCAEKDLDYSMLKPNELVLIANLLECPFKLPEAIFVDLFKDKLKEEQLSKLLNEPLALMDGKKYDLMELSAKEDYVHLMMDRINHIEHSHLNNRILELPKEIELIKTIWKDQSYKRYISEKYLVNECNLRYYEQQFDHLFNL